MTVLSKTRMRSMLIGNKPLIRGYIDLEVQIQPNGFDLSLKEIHKIESRVYLDFNNSNRKLPPLDVIDFDQDGWLQLDAGVYIVVFNEIVTLPDNLMALGRPRSSLLRMGVTVDSAVWDAGYSGRSQCLLVVHNLFGIGLQRNARILQLVFMQLDSSTEVYQGIYQGENLQKALK